MKILILLAFCLLAVATCKEKSGNTVKVTKSTKAKHIVFIDIKGKHYSAFGDIPDSLRTAEQKIFVKSLYDVLLNGVKVENNHMVLKLTKEECMARGMIEKDYNELQKNLHDNNRFFDSLGNKNVAAMIDDMHKALRAQQTDN